MTVNWKEEVEKRKDAYLDDLFTLLRIPSVREDALATEEEPVGPGPKRALEAFLSMAEKDGFKNTMVGNIAGRVEFGSGDETLGILGHLDVVPVDDQWKTPPFEPTVVDGRIYARGASDDKGPMLAAYYALKIIRDLELPVSKKVHFIVGTDEESNWKCMKRYFETEPMPDFGFSPDAEFPIINGEKGLYTVTLHFDALSGKLRSFTSGQRVNMVPGHAEAELTNVDSTKLKQNAEHFSTENPVKIKVTEQKDSVKVEAFGRVFHGAQPENGENAATYLATFLCQSDDQLQEDPYLKFICDVLHEDFEGEKLGINHHDEIMGNLSMNAGLFGADDSGQYITINCRVPQGKPFDELSQDFARLGERSGFTVEVVEADKLPHYVSGEDPLVQTLLSVYEEHTGLKGYEQVIGGATYGRLFKRGVAFGAAFPDTEDTMHQPNEYSIIDNLMTTMAIYADAIYRLIK